MNEISETQPTKKYQYDIDTAAQTAPAKIIRAVGIKKRVLEVGCASGVQSRILTEVSGCQVTGIEIDAAAAQEARKYCESVIVGDLEAMDLGEELRGKLFEVIIIADVLEHLRNPAKVLEKLKKFLQPGGLILASIPNVVHAGLILEMAKGRFDYRPYGLLDDTHLRFFTLKTVHRLFEDCGLHVSSIDRVIRSVAASEFFTRPPSEIEQQVLDFIRASNPEWQTYQFIVSATIGSGMSAVNSSAVVAYDEVVRDLEIANASLAKQVRTLQGQINWIESRPLNKFAARLKSLLK